MNLLTIHFLPILMSLTLFSSSLPEATIKSGSPNFRIIQSKIDSTLTKNESLFELHFSGTYEPLDPIKEMIISCNGVILKAKVDSNGAVFVPVVPGKYKFQFYYNQDFFEITTDSVEIQPNFRSTGYVRFQSSVVQIKVAKPVIYLYPEQETSVSVKLNFKGDIEFTYPKYDTVKGWTFLAKPDGTLHFGHKEHHYLFWDGTMNLNLANINLEEGFLVSNEDLISFFEEKLTLMGLNAQEQEDFITYWSPQMIGNERCYVRFLFKEEFSQYATLDINPKPDHLFRVFMLWSPVDKTISNQIEPQKIESFKDKRNNGGFSVVEWGGSEIQFLDATLCELK